MSVPLKRFLLSCAFTALGATLIAVGLKGSHMGALFAGTLIGIPASVATVALLLHLAIPGD